MLFSPQKGCFMETVSFDFDFERSQLNTWTRDAIGELIKTCQDLNQRELMGPYSPRLNPFLWEVTHALWFIENWTLRYFFDEEPYFDGVDELYDSPRVRHGNRWTNDLKPFGEVQSFARRLRERLSQVLEDGAGNQEFLYQLAYSIFHADMHVEALTYQRHTRGLSRPSFVEERGAPQSDSIDRGDDVTIPGGTYLLGALKSDHFAFDNEKWAHSIDIEPFSIARTPVTHDQFREFVEDGGYTTERFWTPDGWEWLQSSGLTSPLYWRKSKGRWERRFFDDWVPLSPEHPVTEINYHEARAYCNWADRRLPTEAEWELAAGGWQSKSPDHKRTYPWGEQEPDETFANLDCKRDGTVPVGALPDGDSPFGCRQMIGNCWEWTCSPFERFPGYEPDFYQQYSEPWFGSRYVLRGGSWMTRSRLIRSGFRNFFTPDRNDIPAGFRTCALSDGGD
jgi:iron(II)-dependent oxidoreductase